ncbi:MAG: hypothetical protein ABSB19_09020, partial [Methylomonas sp.]
QARQEYLREQRTREIEREQDREENLRLSKELEAAQIREAEAQQREAAALAKIDRLKALLSGKDKPSISKA